MHKDYPADENQLELYKHFPSTHFLSNKNNVINVLAWCTFWRRNLHLFVQDYLKIKLYEYQQLTLYLMGISNFICIIASRNNAKSFLIALYGCCRCILYPGTIFRIGSATLKQAKLIVTDKVLGELCEWSPQLRREIADWSTNDRDIFIKFRNGSKIAVFVANDNARGLRAHVICREEFRQMNKQIEDRVISPIQTPRNQTYMLNPYYGENVILQEDPVDIYISSSWIDDGNWMWSIVEQAYDGMANNNGYVFLAFDESITLKHHFKKKNQLLKERKKQDIVSWKTEFLNLRVKESLSSYFTYTMLTKCQTLKNVFYPRFPVDYKNNRKNKYQIPKLENEVRVISNDIAFVSGDANDKSVYSCIRAIPECNTYNSDNGTVEIKSGYKREYSYIESNQLGDTTLQAVRIRQLYEDFDADYIVIDTRNGGLQVLYSLQKVLYDESREKEYPPLKCMNNDTYAKACSDPHAKPCIFAINATMTLNSDIATAFRQNLLEDKISFLINYNNALEEILSKNEDYKLALNSGDEIEYEKPFIETQAMINECAELLYERMPQTGIIRVYEKGKNRKDRYTSCSYGSYFIDQLELDINGSPADYEYSCICN